MKIVFKKLENELELKNESYGGKYAIQAGKLRLKFVGIDFFQLSTSESATQRKKVRIFLLHVNTKSPKLFQLHCHPLIPPKGHLSFTKNHIITLTTHFLHHFLKPFIYNTVQNFLPATRRFPFCIKNRHPKIVANADGIRLLRTITNRPFDASRIASASAVKPPLMGTFVATSIVDRSAPVPSTIAMNGDNQSLADVKPRIADEPSEKSRFWKLTEVNEPAQCRSLRLPDSLTAIRVSRLIYTNSGFAILALAANAVHKLWKWPKNDRNTTVKASANIAPQKPMLGA